MKKLRGILDLTNKIKGNVFNKLSSSSSFRNKAIILMELRKIGIVGLLLFRYYYATDYNWIYFSCH